MELENILDEQDINTQEIVGLKLELKKLSWWSKMMSVLAIIGSIIFFVFALVAPLSSPYIPSQVFWLFFSYLIASILIVFFSITVFSVAKRSDKFILSESEDDLDNIIKKNRSSWRLGAFVFMLMAYQPINIISTELYRDYTYSYSLGDIPTPEETTTEEPMTIESPQEVVFPELEEEATAPQN